MDPTLDWEGDTIMTDAPPISPQREQAKKTQANSNQMAKENPFAPQTLYNSVRNGNRQLGTMRGSVPDARRRLAMAVGPNRSKANTGSPIDYVTVKSFAMFTINIITMAESSDESKHIDGAFGPVFVVEPTTAHTHTAILLHGRGSDGEEFAEELFDETKLSDGTSLAQKLPGWRWVFPSSRKCWSTTFQEEMPAWFEAPSLTNTTAAEDAQVPGIKESTAHVQSVIQQEIKRLNGMTENVVLGGISQGGAIAIWTLLCRAHGDRPLGAFFAASTWLPFAHNIEDYLLSKHGPEKRSPGPCPEPHESDAFVADMLDRSKSSVAEASEVFLSTPVFLGHGQDDAYVDIELGREVRDVLSRIGFSVEWKEYVGAEQEGHWIKSPEEVDDLLEFLTKHVN
ncbi:acyl thioesterase 1 [Fusarium heterosporum]|uniref:Acyl thioesterase 1 n=1 Tax=Fusarium heterosporum TaxID=42747 RepID=A0A8H5T7K3_FUSHE|nr:acyl thioesterase 1 [Fusarium heterosporum]